MLRSQPQSFASPPPAASYCSLHLAGWWWLAGLLGLFSCRPTNEPASVLIASPLTPPQAALVSIQPLSATTAEVVLKTTQGLATNGWQLTVRSPTGQILPFQIGAPDPVGPFSLLPIQLSALQADQTYQLSLQFRFNNQDSVTALRSYTHRPMGAHWTRLAHAPLDGGDYTAYPVSDAYSNLLLGRYAGSNQMQAWLYAAPYDKWYQPKASLLKIQPRRGLIQLNLYYYNDSHYIYGLGYAVNDQVSDPYFYYHDLWAIIGDYDGPVVPAYQGEDGDVAFFITRDSLTATESAYFLTQNGSPAMRSIEANFPQLARAPLPEAPATLATFTANNIGYVVNQLARQPAHVWAYDPKLDRWQRRADFPGPPRSRGIGFALGGQGYFGLGVQPTDGNGLRDLWQYDPTGDRWHYLTDYPGQGNRYLAVLSTKDRVFLGWGYESQVTAAGPVRQVPCTDWWSFQP